MLYSPRILDQDLNAAVLHLAALNNPRGYGVSADAPNSYDALVACFEADGRITVWDGGSDETIFGDPEVNYAFRAWHDAGHLKLAAAFDRAGEAQVCAWQCAQLVAANGPAKAARWCTILQAEIIGQADYCAEHGDFPTDQFAFDLAYLATHNA